MVTHIPSPTSSVSSLPLGGRPHDTYPRPHTSAYASSQAGSVSASRRPPASSHYQDRTRSHSRARSTSSTLSSQSTLVPRSVAGYPTSGSHLSSFSAAPSAYKAPSAASTSAARPRHGHRTSSHSRRSREETPEANVFPWFSQTGDVEIVLRDRSGRTEKRYLLHHLILVQNSKWFERDVAEARVGKEDPRRGSATMMGTGQGIAYDPAAYRPVGGQSGQGETGQRLRYELDWRRFIDDQQRVPGLVRKDHTEARTSRKPPMSSPSFLRSMTSSSSSRQQPMEDSEDADVLTAYNNLFLSFYNHTPILSTTNIATAYVDSKLLLALASTFGAIAVIGPRIDHHLLQFGSRLWKQIAKYPPSYLKLGYLARSKAIFSEALIHVVGAWPSGQLQLKRDTPGVPDAVVDLIEDKVDELEDTKLRTEAKLFRLNLTTGRGERVAPSNAYTEWLALSFFRQWIIDATAPSQVGILKDSGSSSRHPQPVTPPKLIRAYRLLATGGHAYLTHDECKRFLKLNPSEYSRDNLRRFERRIEELKNLARDVVRPLSRNSLQLDVGSKEGELGVAYLTCTRIEDRDFEYVWGR